LEVQDASLSVHQRLAILACAVAIDYDFKPIADADGLKVRKQALLLKKNAWWIMKKGPTLVAAAARMWKVVLLSLAALLHVLGIPREWLGVSEQDFDEIEGEMDDAFGSSVCSPGVGVETLEGRQKSEASAPR
jgi:hypothetical protein